MKRLIIIFPVLAITIFCLLQACKKSDQYPSRVVTISYPVITLQGAPAMTINHGAAWNDPGATWKDSVTGESGTVTVSVNTSSDSAYLLVYTATNKNGFQASAYRALAVTNMSNSMDIGGLYGDSNGGLDSLYKVSRALFYHPNADLYGDAGYIAVKSDSTISVATLIVTITGASIPETFTSAHISYSPAIKFFYNVTPLNVPTATDTFAHQ